MKPLVTIITPTFNIISEGRKKTLYENIESVSRQSYSNIEHLIIDGGSNDGTIDLLMSFGNEIMYYTEPDKGLYDAMNKGILRAKGEYILILNSDDKFICDRAIEKSIHAIYEYNADFTYAKAKCIDAYGKETPMPNCYAPDIRHIFTEMTVSHQTILCKRRFFENNLFSLELEIGSDYEWLLKTCMAGAVPAFVDEYIVEYHRGGKSDRIKNYHKYIDERVKTFYNIFHLYDPGISEYMCKMIFFEQYICDRIWNCVRQNVAFEVKRGYIDKEEEACKLLENTWYVTAKNALLLRLFQNYAKLLSMGKSLADVLIEKGYKNCAVYGFGNIGQCVYADLINHEYTIKYVVDKSAMEFIGEDSLECDIYTLEDDFPQADILIVTPVFYYRDICEYISERITCPIVSLDDLIQP